MSLTGGCHCGAIRYEVVGEPLTHAICHCRDCRRHAGAPMVAWTMYPAGSLRITRGTPKVYASSEHGRRQFCADCGTGLFYCNDSMLPGIVDVQSATYDEPDAVPARADGDRARYIPPVRGVLAAWRGAPRRDCRRHLPYIRENRRTEFRGDY